jgi:hypothetical protein
VAHRAEELAALAAVVVVVQIAVAHKVGQAAADAFSFTIKIGKINA